jgi:hypothetical protein
MTTSRNLLPIPLNAAAVRSYINFDGGAQVDVEGSTQAQLQSRGVAVVWHLLTTKGYGYLADEVGMGKTRQALGVIATQFLSEPDSHVVIICPGKPLQAQWSREWDTFIRTCYKSRDDRLVSTVDGKPLHRPQRYERLSDFAKALLLNEGRIHLLRYSSFQRPVWFGRKADSDTVDTIRAQYAESLREIGIDALDASETALLAKPRGEDWRDSLTEDLNEAYARRVGQLVKSRTIDLLTLDEAQYLRHVENHQNTNLAHVFRGHVEKWQFLSATPLHSGPGDIKSLDTYLCRQADGHDKGKSCASCTHPERGRCSQAAHRMSGAGGERTDVVKVLRDFMVRRPRMHIDGDDKAHGKVAYRSYKRVTTSSLGDPFLSLTMAVVQKQLVHVLNGQSNRFRQGECSSFESLSSSVKRLVKDKEGKEHVQREIDRQETTGGKPPEETPDRSLINQLNASFFKAMLPGVERGDPPDPKYNLPHAKLSQVCDSLAQACLRDGELHKTLVFVRRIDTVNELVLGLMSRFQDQLDGRLAAWRDLLSTPGDGFTRREDVWDSGGFWNNDDYEPVSTDDPAVDENGDGDAEDPQEEDELSRRAGSMPYFAATKKASGKRASNGKLYSFQSRLLTAPTRAVPFAGFLLHRAAHPGIEDAVWDKADAHWARLVALLFEDGKVPAWLSPQDADAEADWKIATLKRCLLQVMRHSDLLVDLYILNRYVRRLPGAQDGASLPEKLVGLLRLANDEALPTALRTYLPNWIARLRLWIEHFDLIVDKCLRNEATVDWKDVHANVDPAFTRMAPVVGRSGMLSNKYAVTQFNFPSYPNILVCTDVLKEGVDMHLFCDEIVHYGVAWTSGDLEQRIGRIDRFGSQISRRLRQHQVSSLRSMPRLAVEFPYLEGTLDRYQVERVMLAKVQSDMRMDLGKQQDELGHITIGRLDNPSEAVGAFEQALEQYPDCAGHLLHGGTDVPGAFFTMGGSPVENVTHAPELDAMIVRREQLIPHPLLRATNGERKRSAGRLHLEYLLPRAQHGAHEPAPLRKSIAFALMAFAEPCGFHLDRRWNTLAREVSVRDPFVENGYRRQPVLLERLQDFYLLRTPVARADGVAADRLDALILQENGRRRWSYLVKEHGIVWLVCLALSPHGLWLDRLSERLAKLGNRLQHLHANGDASEEWQYRAVASIGDITAAHATFFFQGNLENFMTPESSHLAAHGRLLAGAQQWLADAFDRVLSTLYGNDDGKPRGLEVLPITLLPNGVLHIRSEGRERFNLEAYLELASDCQDNAAAPAPRIVWQVVASTSSTGQKPELPFAEWAELPHMSMDGWKGERRPEAAVYFSETNRRYAVLYHHPAMWDSARKELIDAWSGLLGKMTSQNFQQKYARDAFFKALGA